MRTAPQDGLDAALQALGDIIGHTGSTSRPRRLRNWRQIGVPAGTPWPRPSWKKTWVFDGFHGVLVSGIYEVPGTERYRYWLAECNFTVMIGEQPVAFIAMRTLTTGTPPARDNQYVSVRSAQWAPAVVRYFVDVPDQQLGGLPELVELEPGPFFAPSRSTLMYF